MSKIVIYSIVSGIAAISVASTFLFPVVQSINSIFSNEKENNMELKSSDKTIHNYSMPVDKNENIDRVESEIETNRVEHPSVVIGTDTIAYSNNNANPKNLKFLKEDIPHTKNF